MALISYDEMGGYLPFTEETYIRANNPYRVKRSYDRINLALKYSTQFKLEGENNFYAGFIVNKGHFDFTNASRHSTYNDRLEYVASIKFDHTVSPNYSYFIKAYYHKWWSDYGITTISLVKTEEPWGFYDWGIHNIHNIKTDGGSEFLIGLDIQNSMDRDDTSDITAKTLHSYALFAQYRPHFDFYEDWKLALAARYNYLDMPEDTHSSLVWNISSHMPILPDDKLFISANIGTSFMAPTVLELYQSTYGVMGNPDLQPQKSLSFNVAIGTRQNIFDFQFLGFYDKTTNRIQTNYNVIPPTMINVDGKTTTWGYTLESNLYPVEGLTLTGSYTSTYYESIDNGVKTTFRSNYPMQSAKFNVQWDGKINDVRYGLGLYNSWIGDNQYMRSNVTYEFGNYWLSDVSIYVQPTERLKFTLSLINIFDYKYAYGYTFVPVQTHPEGGFWSESQVGIPFNLVFGVQYKF
jgi:outer membrane cobalamin receptor